MLDEHDLQQNDQNALLLHMFATPNAASFRTGNVPSRSRRANIWSPPTPFNSAVADLQQRHKVSMSAA